MQPDHDVYWYAGRSPGLAPLKNNISADVVVVGGGMAGLTVAEALARGGKEVALLEKDVCGSGASGKSSGFITPDSELELGNLIDAYGPAKAKKLWGFVTGGVEHIRRNIEARRIECDYRVQDSLFVAKSPRAYERKVKAEHEARQSLGYPSTLYERAELLGVIGLSRYDGGVRYPDTFGMNAYAYCEAMKTHLGREGVAVYERSAVTKVLPDGVEANGFRVTAPAVVLATDHFAPALGKLTREIYHAQTFLGVSAPLSSEAMRRIFPSGGLMVWDTDFIYHYFRPAAKNRILIGGADLRYTYARRASLPPPQAIVRKLAGYLAEKFPGEQIALDHLWPGLIGISKDLLPIAGEDKRQKQLYCIGAAAGLPWAAALGTYIAQKILEGRDDLDPDFAPGRPAPLPRPAERILGMKATFAISNGLSKLR